jgi:DNA-3-methyladenine glycosylase II
MIDKDFNKGLKKLKEDKDLSSLISEMDIPTFPTENNHFQSLIKFIIYQQLSLRSAKAIYDRLLLLFQKNGFYPQNFKKIDPKKIFEAGVSRPKIKYMNEVADTFIKEKNYLKNSDNLSDTEIIETLVKIKGIGPWTAEMFLMFTLNRLDIFPLKDLGIQKGIQQLYKLDKIPSDQYMIKKSNQWAPYRTIASLYLWKLIDGNNFDW